RRAHSTTSSPASAHGPANTVPHGPAPMTAILPTSSLLRRPGRRSLEPSGPATVPAMSGVAATPTTIAVVPLKALAAAKGRLAQELDPERRRELVRWMFSRT